MVVIVQTGSTKSTFIRVNITAYNPRKIGIFVSEYTFSEPVIKKYFVEILIQQNNIFINSMAASLQNARPKILKFQYLC